MTIFNFTPHTINIVDPKSVTFDATIRKNVADPNAPIVATIPSKGVLSAKITTVSLDPINDIPIFDKRITGCDPLPDIVGDNDIVVVSALYASAYYKHIGPDGRLFTIADPVYTPDGKTILGSLGICKY